MRDHADLLLGQAELVLQARRAVARVDDDAVHPLHQPARRRDLAGPRLARDHVVRGQHERAPAREQVDVERLDGQPLEVDDVGAPRGAPVAEHLGHVLGELDRHAAGRIRAAAAGEPVEAVVDAVALGLRDGAIGEAARDQLDVETGARERGRERVVVGRREGGRVDEVDAHEDRNG